MLAQPLEEGDLDGLDPQAYLAEWKWDGIRVQLVGRGGERRLYSRSGDDIGGAFPDILAVLPDAVTLDGELLVMRDGVHGYMVDPADSAERFAGALGLLLDSEADRARMGAAGRREALERYSWPRVASQLETYYTDLIAGRQPTWANARL